MTKQPTKAGIEHWFAWLTLCATFALIFIGGTVNPTGSSLACPEPTLVCNGQLFPELTGGVLFEHGHRLAGMTVGFLQIALTVLLWRRRRDLRRLGLAALALVCVQGTFGAITVAMKLSWVVSTTHLITAMGYTALLIYLVYRTGAWRVPPAESRQRVGKLAPYIGVAAGLILTQILLGGLMRHNGAALASIQFPLHDGSLWPEGPMALKLHMAHRLFGVFAGLFAAAVGGAVFRAARGWTRMRIAALAIPLLVAGQVVLGAVTILYMRPVHVVVAHFMVAVALWVLTLTMFLMIRRAPTQGAA